MSHKPHEAPATEKTSERNDDGQFARGNSGGPGNPFARQVAALRKQLLDVVSPDELRKLVGSLVERAIAGDVAAAKLVFQYTLGKPAPMVDPDRLDVDEFRLREESAIPADAWMPTFVHLPAETVNIIGDSVGPAMARKGADAFLEAIKPDDGTPASRRASRKAMKRFLRAVNPAKSPSPNGSFGGGSKLRFDKHGFPLDHGFGPNRAG